MRRLFQHFPKMSLSAPVPIVPMLYKRRFSLYNDIAAFRADGRSFSRPCSHYSILRNQMERG